MLVPINYMMKWLYVTIGLERKRLRQRQRDTAEILILIVKNWKQPHCPSPARGLNQWVPCKQGNQSDIPYVWKRFDLVKIISDFCFLRWGGKAGFGRCLGILLRDSEEGRFRAQCGQGHAARMHGPSPTAGRVDGAAGKQDQPNHLNHVSFLISV